MYLLRNQMLVSVLQQGSPLTFLPYLRNSHRVRPPACAGSSHFLSTFWPLISARSSLGLFVTLFFNNRTELPTLLHDVDPTASSDELDSCLIFSHRLLRIVLRPRAPV